MRKRGKFNEAGIASAYKMGSSLKEICSKFGCSIDTMYRIIREYGIPERRSKFKNSVRSK